MFYCLLYFLVAYLLVAGLCAATGRVIKRLPGDRFDGERRRVTWRVSLAVLLSLPLLPYVLVAVQTALFLPSLRPAIRQAAHDATMIGDDTVPHRILWITPTVCYAVVRDPSTDSTTRWQAEFVITLRRTPTGWRLHKWDAVWSNTGSADGNTFPPVWDDKGS